MPTDRPARVGGSANTVFTWAGQVIAFADSVTIEPVTPVATPEVVQPLNARRPVEIAVPGAARNGIIRLTLKELYNQTVWRDFRHLADSTDLVDIFQTIANLPNDEKIQVVKHVTPHLRSATGPYYEIFHDVVVANVADGETIDITTMTVNKEMELWYTYTTRHNYNGSPNQPKYPRDPINTVRL